VSGRALTSGRFGGAEASQLFIKSFTMETLSRSVFLLLEIKYSENINKVALFSSTARVRACGGRAGKLARGSRAGSSSEWLGSARSGSRASNEPSRVPSSSSFLYRAESARKPCKNDQFME
jgi:hypothetical protein